MGQGVGTERLTICHVEEGKDSNECDNDRAGCCRVRFDAPSDGLCELREPAGEDTAQHYGAPVDAADEKYTT